MVCVWIIICPTRVSEVQFVLQQIVSEALQLVLGTVIALNGLSVLATDLYLCMYALHDRERTGCQKDHIGAKIDLRAKLRVNTNI